MRSGLLSATKAALLQKQYAFTTPAQLLPRARHLLTVLPRAIVIITDFNESSTR